MKFEAISTSCLNDGDTPWVPFAPYSDQVHIKYFKIDPVQGEVVVLLKLPRGPSCPATTTPERLSSTPSRAPGNTRSTTGSPGRAASSTKPLPPGTRQRPCPAPKTSSP